MKKKIISTRTLRSAPPYAILRRDAAEIRVPKRAQPEHWAIFDLDGGATHSEADRTFALNMYCDTIAEIRESEPERCDDTAPSWFTDEHAALCALAAGHTLIKLYDEGDLLHYRWYLCTERKRKYVLVSRGHRMPMRPSKRRVDRKA